MKILLIANPVSGKMGAKTAMLDALEVFCRHDHDVTVKLTQSRGHCTSLAAGAKAAGYDCVVCCGGDGTFNEAINGILQNAPLPIGYIPCGSTNDFASTLGLSSDPSKAAETIMRGKTKKLDVGRFNDKIFSYIASFGAFTQASYSAPQELKNRIGHLAYIIEGIKDVANIKPHKVSLTADGKEYSGSYIFGSVSNTSSVGGIVKLREDFFDLSDGLFEVTLVKNPKGAVQVNEIISGALTSNLSGEMFESFKAKHIEFRTAKTLAWTLDGEKAITDGTAVIDNLHDSIELFV